MKDGKGNVVETKPMLLSEGTTEADFEFVTPFPADHEFTGVWDVNGKKVDFDAANKLAAIDKAVKANNQINLQKALDAADIKYADELRIGDYLTALDEDALKSLDAVQEAITQVDENEATATDKGTAVKAVEDAKTQAQLLNALKDNFDRVNPDWIVSYASSGKGDLLNFKQNSDSAEVAFGKIQDKINTQNLNEVTPKVEAANMSLDSKKVAEARDLVTKWIPSDKDKVTIKDWALDGLDLEDALIAVNNAKTNSALKSALTNLDKVENKFVEKYKGVTEIKDIDGNVVVNSTKVSAVNTDKFDLETVLDKNLTDYRKAIADAGLKDKNQRSDIQTIINNENTSFGSLQAEESRVEADDEAQPKFTIKALKKNGEIDTSKTDFSGTIKVTINGETKDYKVTTSNNFQEGTNGELKIEANGSADKFDLSKVGTETEASIEFTPSTGDKFTVKAPVKVTAGSADDTKTGNTFTLNHADGKYTSGEDVNITFTLKDSAGNTIASENGTHAATVAIADGDTYYQNIKFVDGKASVTVPARTAVSGKAVTVTFKDSNKTSVTVSSGDATVTASKTITIKAGEFSKLAVAQDSSTKDLINITAKDGVNTVEDFAGNKLVNIKAVKVDGENETPVPVAGTDYQGNVTKTFTTGAATHDTNLSTGTYKVTVTVGDVSTTETITIP